MDKQTQYVVCVSGKGDELSVLKGKLYRVVDSEPNDPPQMIRILDETGEDYLYPREWFGDVQVSDAVAKALEAA